MYQLGHKLVRWWQTFRSKSLRPTALLLRRCHITANHLTFVSFLCALLAAYFLFESHSLFVLFALLHLLFDGLDGVIARESTKTKYGAHYDYLSDRSATFFLLLKMGFFLKDYYIFIVLVLFVLTQIVYVVSKFKAPILFSRTIFLFLLIFWQPTLGYLTEGVVALYCLARQLQWFFVRAQRK